MNKKGAIIVIEDDADDRYFLSGVFKELDYPNEVIFFEDGETALDYIKGDDIYPFLILSDINLPRLNGFNLRKMIHTNEKLSSKCVPYLFFTTTADKKSVYDAYTMSVQGFFLKPSTTAQLKDTIKKIIDYWKECYAPNHFEGAKRTTGKNAAE